MKTLVLRPIWLVAGGFLLATLLPAQSTDWPATTGNKGSQRYSPLDRIDRDNVDRLEVAWRWQSPDNRLLEEGGRFARPSMQPGSYEATPVKIGNRLYVTTSFSQLAAIDAATGEQLWVFDPKAYEKGRPTNVGFVHRGAAYWSFAEGGRPQGRIFFGTGDAMLHSIDPQTGEPDGGFGEQGHLDLTEGLRRPVSRRHYAISSPPMMCNDVLVMGSSISDGPSHPKGPPGDIRGFDPRTGELLWTFHSVPQEGEVGNDSWKDESWHETGNTNVWTLMSADEELGLVYLPFGTPTNDWYGGHRLGDNLFAESLVAVDCRSGERRWHFQIVHHGLWDYDLPTPPILGDVTIDGRLRKIAAQPTKQGFLFVFDRETGEPIWPIEERPVPQSGILGEQTSPTQPFPTRPPPFEPQGLGLDGLIDFTPEIHARAKQVVAHYQFGALYTPPSERGTILMPGWAGGASFPGGAFDPESGRLFLPSFSYPIAQTLKKPDASRSGFDYVGSIEQNMMTADLLPIVKPPYSRITAYDLGRGEIAWVVPLGDGPRNHPLLENLDLPPLGNGSRGHVLATRTLLFASNAGSFYASASAFDGALIQEEWEERIETAETPAPPPAEDWRFESSKLRALDKDTGDTLWQTELPAYADGTPMTYLENGDQYLVLAIGGGPQPAELIAYRLPD